MKQKYVVYNETVCHCVLSCIIVGHVENNNNDNFSKHKQLS